MFMLVVFIYCVNMQLEHIPVNNGLGWDGKHYANLTIHFEEMALNQKIDSYQYQRILTPALIFYACKWTGITLNEGSVLRVYGYYNLLLLCVGMILFFRWSKRQQYSIQVETIGFAALFLNYAILKNTPYYPILTDITVFVAGIFLIYWIIVSNRIAQWFMVIISPFVFPLFNWMILPLVVLPDGNNLVRKLQEVRFFAITKWIVWVLISVSIVLVVQFPNTVLPLQYQMHFTPWLIPISIGCAGIYTMKLFEVFQSNHIHPEPNQTPLNRIGIVLIILIWMASRYFVNEHSIPEEAFTPMVFGMNLVQQILYFPFSWIWSHITFFGPGVWMLLFWGRTLTHYLMKQSNGVILFAFVSLLLMMGSESRQFMYCWPFWVWLLLPICSKLSITKPQAFAFVVLCLVQSKFWFPINTGNSFIDYDYGSFPNQRYFMNHGPFMSQASNWINLLVAIFTAIIIWFIFCYQTAAKKTSSSD